jgi:hypothetical protein
VNLLSWLVLLLVWVLAATGSGYLLARLAKRLHPDRSLPKLWFLYTVLTATLAAIVLLIGWR